jgi:hypothetical protein
MKLYLLIMILYSADGGKKFEFGLYRLNAACEAAAQSWKADRGGDAYCAPIVVKDD